ncbi:MAG: polyphenol oxidase family protein [Solirubrobacterales bacterium]
MQIREQDELRWLEAELPGARAVFTTRHGGVSKEPFTGLNLGTRGGDMTGPVADNRRRLAAALGLGDGAATVTQVHGADLLEADAPDPAWPDPAAVRLEADGLHTLTPGLALMVLVADCLPVAVAGPGGVAMLHCGWRGLAAGIVERGCRAVEATHAAVGPGIGVDSYEVGDEVLEAFAHLGDVARDDHLDLEAVAVRLLQQAGVGTIETAGRDTHAEPEAFYSHRRDGAATGRQAGLAWIDRG